MQSVDLTTFMALAAELRRDWLPARLEQVYQRDRHTLALCLRTLQQRGWLTVSWHPQAARFCLDDPPPRAPDTFTFSQQLQHQLNGLALVAMDAIAPWERVLDLQFARRPGDPALWHLYIEIMGKYSNVILANQERQIVTAAHQVSAQQSSVRPIQTGQVYETPPALTDPIPHLSESLDQWQERISLVPGPLQRTLLKTYRGLSSVLVQSMVQRSELDPQQRIETLTSADWQRLFATWQTWLQALEHQDFQPGWTAQGYTVLGWQQSTPAETVHQVVARYYADQLSHQTFGQLRHQLGQKLSNLLKKLYVKLETFQTRLQQSAEADQYREQADLLMAHLSHWEPGLQAIALPDFHTGDLVTIPMDPEKNAVQNAQALYKRHQKLKRAREAVAPLLAEVRAEIAYLEQVETSLLQLEDYRSTEDLAALEEIQAELIQQGYLQNPDYRSPGAQTSGPDFYRYQTPSGFEVLIGRNNRQNDQLTFRLAGDYDLWFHTQEIPGSHALLRVPPGSVPDQADLQFVADLTAYYSRARLSDQAPVVYTQPRHVYKPRGAKPGEAIYKQETILWGQPQRGQAYLPATLAQSSN